MAKTKSEQLGVIFESALSIGSLEPTLMSNNDRFATRNQRNESAEGNEVLKNDIGLLREKTEGFTRGWRTTLYGRLALGPGVFVTTVTDEPARVNSSARIFDIVSTPPMLGENQ